MASRERASTLDQCRESVVPLEQTQTASSGNYHPPNRPDSGQRRRQWWQIKSPVNYSQWFTSTSPTSKTPQSLCRGWPRLSGHFNATIGKVPNDLFSLLSTVSRRHIDTRSSLSLIIANLLTDISIAANSFFFFFLRRPSNSSIRSGHRNWANRDVCVWLANWISV